MKLSVAAFLLLPCLAAGPLTTTIARADEPSAAPTTAATTVTPATAESTVRRRWYGSQTLMVDGISILASPAIVGIPGLIVAAPVVHAIHGNWGRAALSVAMRSAGAAGTIGVGAQGSGGEGGAGAVIIPAAAVGVTMFVLASVMDALMAYDDVPAPRPAGEGPRKAAASRWTPSVAIDPKGGASMGLGASF